MKSSGGVSLFLIFTKVRVCWFRFFIYYSGDWCLIISGFGAYFMGHNSINIVQVLNLYPDLGQVDLIVGLRRDQHAIKFYREIHLF